jgi:hypothetical protein
MTPEHRACARRTPPELAGPGAWRARTRRTSRRPIWDWLSRKVDPDRKLTPQERAVLIQSAAKRLSARLNAAKTRKRSQRTA